MFRTIVRNSAIEIHGFTYLDHLPSLAIAVHAHSQTWVLHGQDSRVQGISELREALVVQEQADAASWRLWSLIIVRLGLSI